jgi:hypothetical protein
MTEEEWELERLQEHEEAEREWYRLMEEDMYNSYMDEALRVSEEDEQAYRDLMDSDTPLEE